MRTKEIFACLLVASGAPGLDADDVAAQALSLFDRPWTGSVIRETGGAPLPIFEGWYPNPDGTYALCFGYYSVNTDEDVFIPLGPNNYLEPAQYDGLQPDWFERIPDQPFRYRRRYCAFSVQVPASFDPSDRVTWTLLDPRDGRNLPLEAIGSLNRYYRLDELESPGLGDYAPALSFVEGEAGGRGRNGVFHGPLVSTVDEPLTLSAWIGYPQGDRVWVGWAKHQGPAEVEFSTVSEFLNPMEGPAETTVRFREAGEYIIRIQTIENAVTDFEFHCCWTNGYVRVTVE